MVRGTEIARVPEGGKRKKQTQPNTPALRGQTGAKVDGKRGKYTQKKESVEAPKGKKRDQHCILKKASGTIERRRDAMKRERIGSRLGVECGKRKGVLGGCARPGAVRKTDDDETLEEDGVVHPSERYLMVL